MTRRGGKDRGVKACRLGRSVIVFLVAPAHRDRHHAGCLGGRLNCREEIVAGVVGLEENDVGHRRHHVGPLDVQRLFYLPCPTGVSRTGGVGARQGCRAGLAELLERGIAAAAKSWQAIVGGEGVQVVQGRGIVVGVNDGDGLPAAIALDPGEGDPVGQHAGRVAAQAVSPTDLIWREAPSDRTRRPPHAIETHRPNRTSPQALGKWYAEPRSKVRDSSASQSSLR